MIRKIGPRSFAPKLSNYFGSTHLTVCFRNLADFMGHPEVAPKRIVASVQQVRPLIGIVPITDFLKAWHQAVEQEQADLRYLAWCDEEERQRRAGDSSAHE